MGHATEKEAKNSDTSREVNLFFNAENSNPVVIQQRKTVVLGSMPFQALSCEGGA